LHCMREFKLSETDIWPGCLEIAVEGELDLAVSAELETALDRAVSAHSHVLVDLEACDLLDACCLSVLVRADQELRRRGLQLLLYGVHGQVRRLFALTEVAEAGLVITEAKGEAQVLGRAGSPQRESEEPLVVPLSFGPSLVGYAAG
jgi:anti-anti-sigma factor